MHPAKRKRCKGDSRRIRGGSADSVGPTQLAPLGVTGRPQPVKSLRYATRGPEYNPQQPPGLGIRALAILRAVQEQGSTPRLDATRAICPNPHWRLIGCSRAGRSAHLAYSHRKRGRRYLRPPPCLAALPLHLALTTGWEPPSDQCVQLTNRSAGAVTVTLPGMSIDAVAPLLVWRS